MRQEMKKLADVAILLALISAALAIYAVSRELQVFGPCPAVPPWFSWLPADVKAAYTLAMAFALVALALAIRAEWPTIRTELRHRFTDRARRFAMRGLLLTIVSWAVMRAGVRLENDLLLIAGAIVLCVAGCFLYLALDEFLEGGDGG